MVYKIKKYRWIILALAVAVPVFFGVGFHKHKPKEWEGIESIYLQLQENGYSEDKLAPVDMRQLEKLWQGRTAKDEHGNERKDGWVLMPGAGDEKVRYYQGDSYLLGWQYLERDGARDWYYFEPENGYLLTDRIQNGVVLSKQGYAIAVSAASEDTLRRINETAHCKEAWLQTRIPVKDTLIFSKDITLVGSQNREAGILAQSENMEQVVQISDEAKLTIGPSVTISGEQRTKKAIHVQTDGCLYSYGAVITGAKVGIYSQGNTYLLDNNIKKDTRSVFRPMIVQAEKITYLTSIHGNGDSGVVQDGGTLTMTAGRVYDNGTLGGYNITGSYGGGVRLKNAAVMDMSGGNIGGNRAVYGGGIYIDTGCRLNLTGGSIGGVYDYDMTGSNTLNNGNYVRENQLSGNGYKYDGGGGGGICSKGTIYVTASKSISISNNRSDGSVGGAGILLIEGNAHFSGSSVAITGNTAYSSVASGAGSVVGNEDPNAEGGGMRIGIEGTNSVINCTLNCENKTDFPEITGEVYVRDNTATGDGGGIFVSSSTRHQLVIKGTVDIDSNRAGADGGGGIKTNGGSVFLYGTKLYKNTAENSMGGGLLGAGIVDLENCSIYQNTAGQGGGVAFFTSPQGIVGDGYVHGCQIYKNTAVTEGAGIAVSGTATGRIQGESRLRNNVNCSAVHCGSSGKLILGTSYIYGNDSYGVSNEGNCQVAATVRIGFSDYSSPSEFTPSKNASGGVYNRGNLVVDGSKNFLIYAGQSTALYNVGGSVSFAEGTSSRFFGKDTTQVVWNQGKIIARGEGFLGIPLVTVVGDGVDYGINNDGGSVIWNGNIVGHYTLGNTGMTQEANGKIAYGVYNQNKGSFHMEEGQIVGNQIGMFNAKDSHLYLTGGICRDSMEYGIYCQVSGQLHMAQAAAIDSSNTVFLEEGCYIDINEPLTSQGVIAVLDTAPGKDRVPGRIMARTSYAGGDGAKELYGENDFSRFRLAYDSVDGGMVAMLLDGSQIQGVEESVAARITAQDIYLGTEQNDHREVYLNAWLYDRTAWLGNQMSGSKTDEQYKYFMAGDTGVITFSCQNISQVSIIWPMTGASDELKTYDINGNLVCDQSYVITELTKNLKEPYENSSYQFQVPFGALHGTYYVTVVGIDVSGTERSTTLPVVVGDKKISASFRTRIR